MDVSARSCRHPAPNTRRTPPNHAQAPVGGIRPRVARRAPVHAGPEETESEPTGSFLPVGLSTAHIDDIVPRQNPMRGHRRRQLVSRNLAVDIHTSRKPASGGSGRGALPESAELRRAPSGTLDSRSDKPRALWWFSSRVQQDRSGRARPCTRPAGAMLRPSQSERPS